MNGRVSDHAFGSPRRVESPISRFFDKLPFPAKYGVLIGEGSPQESVAFELAKIKDRGGSRTALNGGWSLDAIGTRERSGLGIAKDLFASHGFELDAGIYATQTYEDIFGGRWNPHLGIGMHVSF